MLIHGPCSSTYTGGPGTGKSTSAAWLYALAKAQGLNAELVREYVKDWAWEGRKPGPFDQIYFLGKQTRRETLVLGKVDVVITDSPVLQGLYYARRFCRPSIAEGIEKLTMAYYDQTKEDGHTHHHVMLTRSKPYNPSGRYQTEEQAREIDVGVSSLLRELRFPIISCGTDEGSLADLLKHVLESR
jgi:hypothetical protein